MTRSTDPSSKAAKKRRASFTTMSLTAHGPPLVTRNRYSMDVPMDPARILWPYSTGALSHGGSTHGGNGSQPGKTRMEDRGLLRGGRDRVRCGDLGSGVGDDRELSGQLPLRSGAIAGAGRSVEFARMQLFGVHEERNFAFDRAAGTVRADAGRGGSRDLSVQHQYRETHLLLALRDAPFLCAAV